MGEEEGKPIEKGFVFIISRREEKRKRKENGSRSRGRVRLSVQGCADRGFGCWKIESSVPIHSERVLSGVEVHDWSGIRYSHSGGVVPDLVFLLLYSLIHQLRMKNDM